jgi:hypothetical protein
MLDEDQSSRTLQASQHPPPDLWQASDWYFRLVPVLLLALQMNYNNKNMLVGAMIVAGYDKHSGGQVGVDDGSLMA